MPDLVLPALDGTNPLGFFAALGVLRAVSAAEPSARLGWRYLAGWRPVLYSSCADLGALVDVLDADRLACVDDKALALTYDEGERDLKPKPECFRDLLLQLVKESSPERRRSVDWAAAFGTDVVKDNNGNVKPTAFHFTAGRQQFLQMVGELQANTGVGDLLEAVGGPWLYTRPLPVLRWDCTMSRDYALRASAPADEKALGVPGAEWLAFRGIAFFPACATGNGVATSGCSGGWFGRVFSAAITSPAHGATISAP